MSIGIKKSTDIGTSSEPKPKHEFSATKSEKKNGKTWTSFCPLIAVVRIDDTIIVIIVPLPLLRTREENKR